MNIREVWERTGEEYRLDETVRDWNLHQEVRITKIFEKDGKNWVHFDPSDGHIVVGGFLSSCEKEDFLRCYKLKIAEREK